ncbi:MAG TPA: FAD-dependent oxidoreductase, partial [Pirellulales bacterium]|nr:FAD-dependent oxidoreductase [Pirellulales bacterium]
HNIQRVAMPDGSVRNEGDVQVRVQPYEISFRAILPKAAEADNLLVPVCLSATHISYGSIRMEPVFMVLGQSAATAACQAIDAGRSVQEIDTKALAARLLADDQVLEWKGPKRRSALDPRRLPGIVMDDTQAQLEGDWVEGQTTGGFIGSHYLHDGRQQQGAKRARFVIPIEKSGSYEVRLAYTTLANRATNVPVTIEAADGQHQVTVNERREPAVDKLFQPLGTFHFERGKPAIVVISNAHADGYVIVDAVQLLPKPR